jgi:hypothetical protein
VDLQEQKAPNKIARKTKREEVHSVKVVKEWGRDEKMRED